MKVRYIGISTTLLSYGEVYKVLKESEHFYEIIANGGTKCSVHKRLFEIVKENNEMKDLTLPEVFNYPEGTKFKIGFDNWKEDQYIELELYSGELWYDRYNVITDVYSLKDILDAKFILMENWKEISYYDAYTSNNQVKFVVNDVEQIGTHYGILSELNSQGEDIKELLHQGRWYVKED